MADFINTIDLLGDDAVVDSIIDRSITEFKDDQITVVGGYAFRGCAALNEVDLPNVTELKLGAFANCSALESVNLPELTTLVNKASYRAESLFSGCTSLRSISLPKLTVLTQRMFYGCTALESVYLPEADAVGVSGGVNYGNALFSNCKSLKTINLPKVAMLEDAFVSCSALEVVDLGAVTSIGDAFQKCAALTTLIIRTSTIATLKNDASLSDTLIGSGTGYIYVPAALIDSYKAATNWSTYADQFRALEDYTVDGTTTGELDETKI